MISSEVLVKYNSFNMTIQIIYFGKNGGSDRDLAFKYDYGAEANRLEGCTRIL